MGFTSRATQDTHVPERSFKIRRISNCHTQNNNPEVNGQRLKIPETCFD